MWVRNNKGNVFVGNLPPDISDERLAEAFDPFGIVLSAIVARDPTTGARLRYGFVDIATERAATKAIEALDGSEIDGCKLNVKPRDKAPKRPPGGAASRKPPLRSPRPARQGAGICRRVPPPDAAGFGRAGPTSVAIGAGGEPPAGRGSAPDRDAAAPRFRGRTPADPPHDRPEDISGRAPSAAAAGLNRRGAASGIRRRNRRSPATLRPSVPHKHEPTWIRLG